MSAIPVLFLAAALAAGADAPADPAAAQKANAAEFLAKIDADSTVKKHPSGLRIKIEKPGTGMSPSSTDTVRVNYRGTLIDGKEFDSSYKRGKPATFPLNGVIACWTEGLQLLKPGGKATLYCPSEIAYGDGGYASLIPPGATLIFDVELLGIEGPKKDLPPAPKKD
jgi:FKBP-type peptidyl-prolyl cis-trans isomerase FkpA